MSNSPSGNDRRAINGIGGSYAEYLPWECRPAATEASCQTGDRLIVHPIHAGDLKATTKGVLSCHTFSPAAAAKL
jgi:TPP-dependent 2-oxoacid decarboxylase